MRRGDSGREGEVWVGEGEVWGGEGEVWVGEGWVTWSEVNRLPATSYFIVFRVFKYCPYIAISAVPAVLVQPGLPCNTAKH